MPNITDATSLKKSLGKTQTLRMNDRQAQAKQYRLQKYKEEADKSTAESMRRVKEKHERRGEAKERRFQRMLDELDAGQAIKDETTEYLELRDQANKRSKQQLYKDWCKSVYNPLQRDIKQALDSVPCSEIENRRREAFAEYIDTVNRKEGVFRDIIIETDYNPLKNRGKYLKYDRSKYDRVDPLHKDVTQIDQEAALIYALDPTATRIEPKAKDTLDILLWDKLDCTPFARYGTGETEVRHKKVVPGATEFNGATIELSHYKISKDPVLMKSQYFPGGKLIPPHNSRKDNLLYHHDEVYFEKFLGY